MKNFLCVILLTVLFIDFSGVCQTTGNIPLHCKTKFGREGGSGDVWGLQITGANYALVTLDGGLSVVNTDNQSSPSETAHVNHDNYATGSKLNVPDVETFTSNGTTYAYLATNNGTNTENIIVVVINLNKAITDGGLILIDPINDTPNPNNVFAGRIYDSGNINRSHTLTIADGYLYAATLNQYIPVWDLNQNPTSPPYLGAVFINNSEVAVHEMKVVPVSALRAHIYAACVVGGLQVIDVSYIPSSKGSAPIGLSVNSITEHLYDFDRAYPNKRISDDTPFDYRYTHSAWPTDDEQYIFTTDELHLDNSNPPPTTQYSIGDPNLYSTGELKTPRRESAVLRTWETATLGNADSKDGYYVSEDYYQGITDLTIIDTNWTPNSIHQLDTNGDYMFVSHYTQGFRMLDMSDPENLIELGYYDDFPQLSFNTSSDYFFRKEGNWHKGIYGVFADRNRSDVCYAGGSDGFYIFDVTPPPFAPTNLTVNEVNGFAEINWTTSAGPNLDQYKIYRKSTSGEAPVTFIYKATINAFNGGEPVTTWTDVDPYVGSGQLRLYYAISAVDISGSESVLSNYDWVAWDGDFQKKGEERNSVVYEFKLHNNYPNPFNPKTTINYSILSSGLVSLKVYDILGNEVANLVNEKKSEGNHTVEFYASELPSGIYFYKLTSGNFTSVKKMILMK